MPTTALDIKSKLEAGIMTELRKRTYFAVGGSGASVSILAYADNATEKPIKYVVVHAKPEQRLQPNSNFYRVPVAIVCLSHIPNDTNRTSCEALYKEAFSFANTFDKSAVGTSASLTIDGFLPQGEAGDQGEEYVSANDNFNVMIAKVDVFITQA